MIYWLKQRITLVQTTKAIEANRIKPLKYILVIAVVGARPFSPTKRFFEASDNSLFRGDRPSCFRVRPRRPAHRVIPGQTYQAFASPVGFLLKTQHPRPCVFPRHQLTECQGAAAFCLNLRARFASSRASSIVSDVFCPITVETARRLAHSLSWRGSRIPRQMD